MINFWYLGILICLYIDIKWFKKIIEFYFFVNVNIENVLSEYILFLIFNCSFIFIIVILSYYWREVAKSNGSVREVLVWI